MAQALEKVFRGKVAQMPKDEIKIETGPSKAVKKKPPKPPSGTFVAGLATPSPTTPQTITKPQQPAAAKQISNQLEQSFVLPSDTSGAGLSTPKAPISSTPDVQSNLHSMLNATPANASQISTSSTPFLVNQQQPAMNTVPVSTQQPAKVKKGVKRKADTTTPTAMGFNESSDVKALRGRQVNIYIFN